MFHGVIGVFECDRVVDVRETYAQYQQAAKRVMQLAGIPNPGCRLFGFGSDRAVQACRDAVLSNKEMEGLAALTKQEIEDSVMLGFCMLDFAGCMHMNLANAVLELQHKEMSLDTLVDSAFGCAYSELCKLHLCIMISYPEYQRCRWVARSIMMKLCLSCVGAGVSSG